MLETFFKRYFWTLQLGVIALSALLLGAAANRFGLSRAADFSVAVPAEGSATRGRQADDQPTLPEPLSEVGFPQREPERPPNPCEDVECDEGQQCNRQTGQCEATEPVAEEEESEDGPCPDTDISIQLAGTMVADDPAWSVAVLHNASESKTEFVRIGDELMAQATVTAIGRNRVMLLRDGRRECLRPEAFRQAAAARAERQPAVARPSRTTGNRGGNSGGDNEEEQSTEDIARSSVERTGPNEYSIDREALDAVINDNSALREQAPRVSPHYRDGRPNGFRLSGLRSDSIFSQIGIRNGDVIHSVNGQVIDSPQRAMQLYQQLQQTGNVALVVERGGRQQTINYAIQ